MSAPHDATGRESDPAFVITIAGATPATGKTTIAVNLAIYLKALREDLPVTLISFDPEFSVSQRFAINAHGLFSVADLFKGIEPTEIVQMGQYGVQFLESEACWNPPATARQTLGHFLVHSHWPGILILDTPSSLDTMTQQALGAADLVFAPVSDCCSWSGVASLARTMDAVGLSREALWLLPSLIDAEQDVGDGVGLEHFLTFSAEERGYQVAPATLSYEQRLVAPESWGAKQVPSVLSQAPDTAVHQCFRQLASFVLERYDPAQKTSLAWKNRRADRDYHLSRARAARFHSQCPCCKGSTVTSPVWFWEDTARRRQGLIHPKCLENLLTEVGADSGTLDSPFLMLVKSEPGWNPRLPLSIHGFDLQGKKQTYAFALDSGSDALARLLSAMTGLLLGELPVTRVILADLSMDPEILLTAEGYRGFCQRRKQLRSAERPPSPLREGKWG